MKSWNLMKTMRLMILDLDSDLVLDLVAVFGSGFGSGCGVEWLWI